jgi:hypothetical protein
MTKRFCLASTPILLSLAALTILAAGARQALAGGLLPGEANTEVMMNAEGSEAMFIGRYFGGDASSPLSFTSTQDVANQTFSFALSPGSTYLGQAASLTASGYYDATKGEWVVTTNGSIGGTYWSGASSMTINGDPFRFPVGLGPQWRGPRF